MIRRRSARNVLFAGGLALLAAQPVVGWAQEQACQGTEPKGGKWPTSAELYIDRAKKNANPEDKHDLYQQAVDIAREGFQEQPGNPRNYLYAGQAYIGLDNYEQADSMFTKAVDLWSCYHATIDSLRFNAWRQAFNLGVRYDRQDDKERAVDYYRHAYVIYKTQPQPLLQLGSYYAQEAQSAGDSVTQAALQDTAIDMLQKALDAIGESKRLTDENRLEYNRAATFNLAQLLALQDRYKEAAQAYDNFLDVEPDNATAKSNLAVVLTLAAEDMSDSADAATDSAQKTEMEARADSLRGLALTQYKDLMQQEGLPASEYQNIGTGLQRLKANAEAVEAFRDALALEPYRANTLEQLALTLYSESRYDTLATVAETLTARYPANMNNLAILANAYRELDKRQKALTILERREALPFELLNLQITHQDSTYTIAGHLQNRKLDPGTPIQVRFDLRTADGQVPDSLQLSTQAPEQGVPTPFSVSTTSLEKIAGFTYSVVTPKPQPASADSGGSIDE